MLGRGMLLKLFVSCVHACLVAQLCPILCNPMNCSPLGSSVLGIFRAKLLEWVDISSSRGSSQPRGQTTVSCIGRQILVLLSYLGSKLGIVKNVCRQGEGCGGFVLCQNVMCLHLRCRVTLVCSQLQVVIPMVILIY